MHVADRLFNQFMPAESLLQRAYDADTGVADPLNVFDILPALNGIDPETIREVYAAFKPELASVQLPRNGAFNFVLRQTAEALAAESYVYELPHYLRQFNLE